MAKETCLQVREGNLRPGLVDGHARVDALVAVFRRAGGPVYRQGSSRRHRDPAVVPARQPTVLQNKRVLSSNRCSQIREPRC